MIQRQPIGDAPTAIMPSHTESVVPKFLHDGDHVARQSALAIRRVIGRGLGTRTLSVPAQIKSHYRERARQNGSDLTPHQVGLRKAVQHDKGWTISTMSDENARLASINYGVGKLRHGLRTLRWTE